MTLLVALILAGLFTVLKPIHENNEAIYNKKAILSAVASQLDQPLAEMSPEQVADVFTNQIDQKVINMRGEVLEDAAVEALGYKGGKAENVDTSKEKKKAEADRVLPLYTFTNTKGEKTYIVSVRGNGLWDEIWGNIALSSDRKTITGVDFDHRGETPGLGAEIKDNKGWKSQFTGKSLYSKDGKFTSVAIVKGGAKNDWNQVDGISGATITADGVAEMLGRGIQYYEPYFSKLN